MWKNLQGAVTLTGKICKVLLYYREKFTRHIISQCADMLRVLINKYIFYYVDQLYHQPTFKRQFIQNMFLRHILWFFSFIKFLMRKILFTKPSNSHNLKLKYFLIYIYINMIYQISQVIIFFLIYKYPFQLYDAIKLPK